MPPETLTSPFVRELLQQIRASDPYGRLDASPDEALLKPFLRSREERQTLPVLCGSDPAAQNRLRAFYGAAAACVEHQTGIMVRYVLDVNEEGFGRALLYAGRLVLVDRAVRDAAQFGFPTLEKLVAGGEGLVQAAVEALGRFPELARD